MSHSTSRLKSFTHTFTASLLALCLALAAGCASTEVEELYDPSVIPATAEVESQIGVARWKATAPDPHTINVKGFNRSGQKVGEVQLNRYSLDSQIILVFELNLNMFTRLAISSEGEILESTLQDDPMSGVWLSAISELNQVGQGFGIKNSSDCSFWNSLKDCFDGASCAEDVISGAVISGAVGGTVGSIGGPAGTVAGVAGGAIAGAGRGALKCGAKTAFCGVSDYSECKWSGSQTDQDNNNNDQMASNSSNDSNSGTGDDWQTASTGNGEGDDWQNSSTGNGEGDDWHGDNSSADNGSGDDANWGDGDGF